MVADIVKRGGKRPTENYERAKLERSIRSALRSLKTPDGQTNDTARAVCDLVEQWLQNQHEVTSEDLRRKANDALAPLHPEAAFIYKNFKIIL